MDGYLFILFLALLFSVLWFINLAQLLEKLKQNRNIRNQKILGSLWSMCLTLSILLFVTIF